MNDETRKAFLQQIQTIHKTIPEVDRQYHIERIFRSYALDIIEPDTLPMVLEIVDHFFSKDAKRFIHDALRDNAIWPDNVVQSDTILSLPEGREAHQYDTR